MASSRCATPNEAPDFVSAPANFGSELWTSWIRVVPDRKELFEPFLQKILDYYEGRLPCPTKPVVLPQDLIDEGTLDSAVEAGRSPGLDHFDLFMRPAFYTRVGAHGGTGHLVGPHLAVKGPEAMRLFPGAVVTPLSGCHGGDIQRADVTAAEAYLFGRSISVLAFSSTRSEGGDSPTRMIGWADELRGLVPHFGVYFAYLHGLRSCGHSSYLHTGGIMLGSPFVSVRDRFAAPSGTVVGRVTAAAGNPVAGFYISATRGNQWFGRVRTDRDGLYELACLPPGPYEVGLHLNAFETRTRKVTAPGGKTTVVDWELPALWQVHGQVLDAQDRPDPLGWAEVALRADAGEFARNDLFGPRTDDRGGFVLHGAKPATFWLRARSGRKFESTAVPISVRPGQHLDAPALRVGPGGNARRARARAAMDYFACVPEAELEVPSDDALAPFADITGFYVGLVPAGDRTLVGRGGPPGGYGKLERAKPTIRLAFELAESVPATSVGERLRYVLDILADPDRAVPAIRHRSKDADYAIRLAYGRVADKWKAVPDVLGRHPNPILWVSRPV